MKPSLTLIEARVLGAISIGIDPWKDCRRLDYRSHRANQIITQAVNRLQKKGLWWFWSTRLTPVRDATPAGHEALKQTFEWVMGTQAGQRAYREAFRDGKLFGVRP
jgi:hypothetical protein